MKSKQPRKQRKRYHDAPLHKKRSRLASHLADDLIVKYGKRSIPVVRGDTVKVVRGDFKGHSDKVRDVYLDDQTVEIEGAVTSKVDGSKVPRAIHCSNVIITKLNLTDPWRRRKLERGLSKEQREEIEREAEEQIIEQQRMEEEAAAAEEAEAEAAEEAEPEAAPAEEIPGEEIPEEPAEAEELPEEPAEEAELEQETIKADMDESETETGEEPEGEPVEPEIEDAEESESVEEEEEK